MKRLSIFFLAFFTFWMSTWMVTDIHDLPKTETDHPHPIFSERQTQLISGAQSAAQDHEHDQHCGICSYDHGGHIGQTLATSVYVAENIPAQSINNSPHLFHFWYSKNTSPKLRPPIG